jgi:hypothetical protein
MELPNGLLDDVLTILADAPGNRVTETELIASLRCSRGFTVNTYGKLSRRWTLAAYDIPSLMNALETAGITVEQTFSKDGYCKARYYSL